MKAPESAVPVTIIGPTRRWGLPDLGELWRRRELGLFLCWRDIQVRYKQTVLGVLWMLIQPFTRMVVFSLIFGVLAKMDSQGFPYPVFVYAGLLPWQFFSDALTRSSVSIVNNAHVITKVYFPRLIIPLASIGASLLDFALSFLVLLGLMLYYGIVPTAAALMVVPLVVCTIIAALGVGVLLSALDVAYRDFRFLVPFLMQIWMFLTPVVYPVRALPEKWRWVISLNPMSGIVEAWRSAILGTPFLWGQLGISMVVAALTLLVGLCYFRRLEVQFADIV